MGSETTPKPKQENISRNQPRAGTDATQTETPAPEAAPAAQSESGETLLTTPEATDLQKGLSHRVEKITEKQAQDDRVRLSETVIRDIRCKRYLLHSPTGTNEKPAQRIADTKTETARRISAYTDHVENRSDGTWYTLNYKKVKDSHEREVGLGEVLGLDPDIQMVEIEKIVNGKAVKLTLKRAVVAEGKKYAGRVGFVLAKAVSEFSQYSVGDYVPTFTGENFRIVSGNETPVQGDSPGVTKRMNEYVSDITQDKKARDSYREHLKTHPVHASSGKIQVEIDDATLTAAERKLRAIWPEERVPQRYWFNSNDTRGHQSLGRFQFYGATLFKFLKYVQNVEPARWESLSAGVKKKLARQEAIFQEGKSLTGDAKLTQAEAEEVLEKLFSTGLDYKFRAIQLTKRIIPSIQKLASEIPEYADTINELTNDNRYLVAVYDMVNNCGSGGAKKILREAFRLLKDRNINPPTLTEMYVAMVEASLSQFSDRRAIRTLAALPMILGITLGMDKKAVKPSIKLWPSASYERKKDIVEEIQKGKRIRRAQESEQETETATPTQFIEKINPSTGLTAADIRAAERECSKAERLEKIIQRPHFLKIVKYIAKKVGIPPEAIIVVTKREVGGKLDPNLTGDKGKAVGMGGFHKPAHDFAKQYKGIFKRVMANFTEDDPSNIKRAQYIVADLLEIAILLKRRADKSGLQIDHTTKLTREQLITLRFGYHTPALHTAILEGPTHKRYEEAQKWFNREKGSYEDYADEVLKIQERV